MSIYSDKLAHAQVIIKCRYSIAPMCTQENTHSGLFMRAVLDDVMSPNELTTLPISDYLINRVKCHLSMLPSGLRNVSLEPGLNFIIG